MVLIFVLCSCVCPVLKVVFSHVSKIHRVRHGDEKKLLFYSATVVELASDSYLPLSATFGI